MSLSSNEPVEDSAAFLTPSGTELRPVPALTLAYQTIRECGSSQEQQS
jgi:hypothetical protein